MDIHSDIQYVKGVGEARAKQFGKMGVATVSDLLRFYPRAYEDWSRVYAPDEALVDVFCCVRGMLAYPPDVRRIAGGRIIVKAAVTHGDGFLNLVFFNNKLLLKYFI